MRPVHGDAVGYLDYFGFWDFLNKAGTHSPQHRPGRYLSLTTITRESVEESSSGMQGAIEERADQLASVLLDDVAEMQPTLSYCFREMIRNTFEHSGAHDVYLLAQRWPQWGRAEVVVADVGRGIHAAMSESSSYPTPESALRDAILPGVSRVRAGQPNVYGNAGFGLYVTSELAREMGRFFLCSSGCSLQINDSSSSVGETPFVGTLVSLTLDLRAVAARPQILEEIIARGDYEAAQAGRQHRRGPSKRASTSKES